MEINASLLSTKVLRCSEIKENVNFFVSEEILPQTLSVLQTRSEPGVELVIV
jgi:glycine cleavage system pyridoxal-binding protein P